LLGVAVRGDERGLSRPHRSDCRTAMETGACTGAMIVAM